MGLKSEVEVKGEDGLNRSCQRATFGIGLLISRPCIEIGTLQAYIGILHKGQHAMKHRRRKAITLRKAR